MLAPAPPSIPEVRRRCQNGEGLKLAGQLLTLFRRRVAQHLKSHRAGQMCVRVQNVGSEELLEAFAESAPEPRAARVTRHIAEQWRSAKAL